MTDAALAPINRSTGNDALAFRATLAQDLRRRLAGRAAIFLIGGLLARWCA
jgi:hypothetical protein